ncbi:MAG: ShlB/FhaC/HecB family hemolysin secretion/activation protein [Steroidobacterales bacterium]
MRSAAAPAAPKLTTAVFQGGSVYSHGDLFSVYGDQIGRPISRESAQAIVSGLSQLYQRDGYSPPEIRVDDRLAAAGILRVEIYEAQITRVTISGNAGPYRARIEALGGEVTNGKPLQRAELQRVLRSMREFPGLSINAATHRDASRRNAYELALDAAFHPVEGSVRLSNRGTEEIGPIFVLGQIVTNGLLGGEERLGLVFTASRETDEYAGLGAFVDVPAGWNGSHGVLMAFKSRSDPTEAPTDRNDIYKRNRISLRFMHPVATESGDSLSFAATLELNDLDLERDGSQLREERLRILELNGRLGWRSGEKTQYLVTADLRQGLRAFGSELIAHDLTVDPRRPDFLLLRAQLTRLTRLNERWSVRFDGFLQQSGYVLPDDERFKIGGDRLGRGFEVAEIAGDQGLGAKVELRRELSAAGSRFGRTSAYSFYDFGAAWKQDLPGDESAATAGAGVSLQGKHLAGSLELARPLTHGDVEGKKNAALFAELSCKF